jgi:hypothetical protein
VTVIVVVVDVISVEVVFTKSLLAFGVTLTAPHREQGLPKWIA